MIQDSDKNNKNNIDDSVDNANATNNNSNKDIKPENIEPIKENFNIWSKDFDEQKSIENQSSQLDETHDANQETNNDVDKLKVESIESKHDDTQIYERRGNHSNGKYRHTRGDRENQYKKKQAKKIGLIIFLVAILIAGIAGYYTYTLRRAEQYSNLLDKESFYEGIYVDSIALGGLTMDEAFAVVSENQKQRSQEVGVIVTWDDEQIPFTHEDVSIIFDTQEVLDRAYSEGRVGETRDRYEYVLKLVDDNLSFETSMNVDYTMLETQVRNIATFRAKEVGEPSVGFNPDPANPKEEWFNYSQPIVGIQVDPDGLWNGVRSEFENKTYGFVAVPKWEIDPSDGIVDLHDITKEIVSFKSIQSSDSNRRHNVALACSMINGTVLMPGQEFSMNETTGKRTVEAGFKEANTIIGGNELVPGIAGGVCQVSGTLFNAVLRADLEIVERHHHSFELGYLSRGRDATVNYGTLDIRFKNNKDYPVYIAMYTVGKEVYAEIFGAPLENCAYIDIWVKTTEEIEPGEPIFVSDSTVPVGVEPKYLKGYTGIKCTVFKVFKDEDGKQIASEEVHKDYYKMYSPEIHVNPDVYEFFINPTAAPTIVPTQVPAATPIPTVATPAPTAVATPETTPTNTPSETPDTTDSGD